MGAAEPRHVHGHVSQQKMTHAVMHKPKPKIYQLAAGKRVSFLGTNAAKRIHSLKSKTHQSCTLKPPIILTLQQLARTPRMAPVTTYVLLPLQYILQYWHFNLPANDGLVYGSPKSEVIALVMLVLL